VAIQRRARQVALAAELQRERTEKLKADAKARLGVRTATSFPTPDRPAC